jgi:hypothetical protein
MSIIALLVLTTIVATLAIFSIGATLSKDDK